MKKESEQKGTLLDQVEQIDRRINMAQQLVRVSNRQINLLTKQLASNEKKITELAEELELLKKDYAEMIRKSYEQKNQQNRLMFILSADNFLQAYKRGKYMQQYTSYRKKQGESIAQKQADLAALNVDLKAQKEEKKIIGF